MPAGKYILSNETRDALLEEIAGLSFYVVETYNVDSIIAQVDFLRKSGWIISGHFCAFDYGIGTKYCQPMKNPDALIPFQGNSNTFDPDKL